MKRILLLTAAFVAIFTVQAFAALTDTTTVTVTAPEILNIDAPATAIYTLTLADYQSVGGVATFDAGANTLIQANRGWKVQANWGTAGDGNLTDGQAPAHTLAMQISLDDADATNNFVSESGGGDVTLMTGTARDGSGAQSGDLDFKLTGITFTGTPPGSYTTTVNYTISSN